MVHQGQNWGQILKFAADVTTKTFDVAEVFLIGGEYGDIEGWGEFTAIPTSVP